MADPRAQRPLLTQWRLIALIFAILSLLLGGWYYLSLRDNFTLLYSGLPASDAAAITSDLSRRGIAFQTADNGANILVPALQVDAARAAAGSAGSAPHAIEGFELFDQSDMGLNDFAQRIRYQRAIQGELERTIMMMEGVVSARVHVSIPDHSPFRGEQQAPSAAVTVVTRAPQDMSGARVEGIQRLVAASVTGMTAADVVILDARGDVLSPRVEITDVSAALLGDDGQTRRTAIDLVTQIMRTVLPERQFEVRIEQAAAEPSAPANSATSRPVFTRIVRVATELTLSALEQERVRTALQRAGLVDGSLEETVLFSVGLSSDMASPARTVATNAVQSVRPATTVTTAPNANLMWLTPWLGGGLIVIVAFIGVAMVLQQRLRPRLSPQDHESFAERLRQRLGAQPADAP